MKLFIYLIGLLSYFHFISCGQKIPCSAYDISMINLDSFDSGYRKGGFGHNWENRTFEYATEYMDYRYKKNQNKYEFDYVIYPRNMRNVTDTMKYLINRNDLMKSLYIFIDNGIYNDSCKCLINVIDTQRTILVDSLKFNLSSNRHFMIYKLNTIGKTECTTHFFTFNYGMVLMKQKQYPNGYELEYLELNKCPEQLQEIRDFISKNKLFSKSCF